MTILYTEYQTKMQESEAEKVMGLLCATYPGHPWAVKVEGGVIFIRHLAFGANYGMNVKFNNVNHDAAVMKREIVMMAGEWLERAGLARGRSNDDEIVRVEGVPERHQPNQPLENMVVAMPESPEELRTAPRPQALRGT